MNDISNKIIKEIEEKHIRPKSVWFFQAQESFFWAITCLFVFVGSVSFATIITILNDQDYDIFIYLDKTPFSYFVSVIPYIWILGMIIFVLIARAFFKSTKKAFKYNLYEIFAILILLNIAFGYMIWQAGYGHFLHMRLLHDLPGYRQSLSPKDINWFNPDQGLLSGYIESMDSQNMTIKDMFGNLWTIKGVESLDDLEDFKTGDHVKMVGEKLDANAFNAEEIRPWIED